MVLTIVRMGYGPARGEGRMLDLTSPQLQLLLLLVACLILLALVGATRPRRRRLLAALLGGVAFGVLNVGWDTLAAPAGWWRYPSLSTPYAPPAFYVVAALVYGAGMDLVSWRIVRRLGPTGLATFLLVLSILGPIRDPIQAAATHG